MRAVLSGKRSALCSKKWSTCTSMSLRITLSPLESLGCRCQSAGGDGLALPLDEVGHIADRVEILGHEFVVIDRDTIGLLEKRHELEHAGRVDQPLFEERTVVVQPLAVVAEQKVLEHKRPHLFANHQHETPTPIKQFNSPW